MPLQYNDTVGDIAMRIFVSYKGQDIEKVQKTIEEFRNISPDVQVSIIRQSKRWKKIAQNYR
jgi:hypothetical protein